MSTPPQIPGSYRRPIWPWLLLLVPCLVVAVILALYLASSSKLRSLEAQVRLRGEPLTLQELWKKYPQIPEADNAAIALLDLWEKKDPAHWAAWRRGEQQLPEPTKEEVEPNVPYLGSDLQKLGRTDKLDAEALAAAESYLKEQADYIRAMRTALKRPRSCFTNSAHIRLAGPLPYVSALKDDARRLRLIGAVAIEKNRPTEAIQLMGEMTAAGHALKENRLLIDQLVRVSCLSMVLEDAQRLMTQIQLKPADLDKFERVIQDLQVGDALHTALTSERVFCLSMFEMPGEALASLSLGPEAEKGATQRGYKIMVGGMKATGIAAADRRLMLETFRDAIRLTEDGSPDALRAYDRLFTEVGTKARRFPPKIFSGLMLPSCGKAAQTFARFEARRRCALATLAVERYRVGTGKLPESLDAALAKSPTAGLEDPFTGQPLLYQTLDKGFVVYSVGADRADNDGKERDKNTSSEQYDETFIVER